MPASASRRRICRRDRRPRPSVGKIARNCASCAAQRALTLRDSTPRFDRERDHVDHEGAAAVSHAAGLSRATSALDAETDGRAQGARVCRQPPNASPTHLRVAAEGRALPPMHRGPGRVRVVMYTASAPGSARAASLLFSMRSSASGGVRASLRPSPRLRAHPCARNRRGRPSTAPFARKIRNCKSRIDVVDLNPARSERRACARTPRGPAPRRRPPVGNAEPRRVMASGRRRLVLDGVREHLVGALGHTAAAECVQS